MTAFLESKLLELEFADGWLRIFLNAPKTRNALSVQLTGELKSVLHAVRSDSRVRGISLRGCGGVFCAGGDLKAFAAMRELSKEAAWDAAVSASLDGAELFSLVHTAPQVVVALIEGAAIAGGLGMACAADFAYATSDAKFSFSETRLGLTPAQIAPYVINKAGVKAGRHLLLTGAQMGANEAHAKGLVDAVADDAQGLDALEALLIEEVMQCAPGAISATKKVLEDVAGLDVDAFPRRAAEYFADCLTGAEGEEGVAAFFAKRKPSWSESSES